MSLTINKSKTKILTNIINLKEIILDGEVIHNVTDNKYLGQTLTFVDKTEKELKARRTNGWKAFWAQKLI